MSYSGPASRIEENTTRVMLHAPSRFAENLQRRTTMRLLPARRALRLSDERMRESVRERFGIEATSAAQVSQ